MTIVWASNVDPCSFHRPLPFEGLNIRISIIIPIMIPIKGRGLMNHRSITFRRKGFEGEGSGLGLLAACKTG